MADTNKQTVKAAGGFLDILVTILKPIIGLLSPQFRAWITEGLKAWRAAAASTENPWDDIAADLLCKLLGID